MLSASSVTRMMRSGVTTKGGSGPTKPALAMRQLHPIQDDEAVVMALVDLDRVESKARLDDPTLVVDMLAKDASMCE